MKTPVPPPIILASASPRRRELLKSLGLVFKVLPSNVDEKTAKRSPAAIVKELALRKALSVAARHRRGIIIGADTIVVFGREIIGKPEDPRDAVAILSKLNGTTHRVYSGIAVIDAGTKRRSVGYEMSTVKLHRLPVKRLAALAVKHLDKAGAYAVQEKGDAFVEKIEGDYFNVVGLPLKKLTRLLKKFDVKLNKNSGRFSK